MDCGPTCLRMIAKYYGKSYSLQTLRARSFISREGVSLLGISDAGEAIGFGRQEFMYHLSNLLQMYRYLASYIGTKIILSFAMALKKEKGNIGFRLLIPENRW